MPARKECLHTSLNHFCSLDFRSSPNSLCFFAPRKCHIWSFCCHLFHVCQISRHVFFIFYFWVPAVTCFWRLIRTLVSSSPFLFNRRPSAFSLFFNLSIGKQKPFRGRFATSYFPRTSARRPYSELFWQCQFIFHVLVFFTVKRLSRIFVLSSLVHFFSEGINKFLR